AKFRDLYDDWMVHGDREETARGNPKPPPHEAYLQWIVDAWKSIPPNTTSFAASNRRGRFPSGRAAPEESRILDGAALEEALVLDDEDAMLLDVSDSEGGEDSDSDASIESESSSEDVTSQTRAQHATTSRGGAGCTYTPDCQCELCDDDC
ncbi:pogo transposable element with KRAB domain-like protein, partial [Aphelenchoides avenae]